MGITIGTVRVMTMLIISCGVKEEEEEVRRRKEKDHLSGAVYVASQLPPLSLSLSLPSPLPLLSVSPTPSPRPS